MPMGSQKAIKGLPAWCWVWVYALAFLERPQVDDRGDVRLDGADAERLTNRAATVWRSTILALIPRVPDLPFQYPLVEEPYRLILIYELAVFEALVGAKVPPLLLLRVIRPVRILRAGLACLYERARPVRKELDLEGGAARRNVSIAVTVARRR